MNAENLTRLTKADLNAIEAASTLEIAAQLGNEPTLADVQDEQTGAQRVLQFCLDVIGGFGRVITLLAAEVLSAFTPLILMIVFVSLENERLWAGALEMGQTAIQAQLIALAFVVANGVLPLYELRNLKGQQTRQMTRGTVRGAIEAFGRRLFARPQAYTVSVYHNPTLAVAAAVVTWATLILAFLAVLGPMLETRATMPWYTAFIDVFTASGPNEFLALIGGALVSIGGVFFVQSASHEIGVRTLTDLPPSANDLLKARRETYHAQAVSIRENIRQQHMAAKIADLERKEGANRPTVTTPTIPELQEAIVRTNGNGTGNHAG